MRGPALMLALVLLLPLLARGGYGYLLPLLQLCGIYAIIATGLTLLMGFTGQVSMGHAGFYGFGAYFGAVSCLAMGFPVWLAVPLALVAGGAMAYASGCMVLRLKGHHLALATLCLGVIVSEFITKSKITGGAAGLYDLPELNLFGLLTGRPLAKAYFIWFIVWLVLLWALFLTVSPVGRALKAINGDEDAAASLGVPVFQLKLKIFTASGVLAALGGVLYAFVYTPSYLGPEEFGLMFSITLVTMAVVGGMGSIWGGIMGAIVMTMLHEAITTLGGKLGITDISRYEQLLYGLLLVCTLIYFPRGLAPAIADRLAGWARPKNAPGTGQ
jgi:branched-chain amino acid transport system permease protein